MDRVIDAPDPATIDHVLATPIDWDAVNERLAELRAVGADYLETEIAQVAK